MYNYGCLMIIIDAPRCLVVITVSNLVVFGGKYGLEGLFCETDILEITFLGEPLEMFSFSPNKAVNRCALCSGS